MNLLYDFSTASPGDENALEESARTIAKQIHTIAKQTKKFINLSEPFHSFSHKKNGPLLYTFAFKTLHKDFTEAYELVIIFQRNGCVAFELMGPGIGISLFKNIPGQLLATMDKPMRDYLNAKPAEFLTLLEPFRGNIKSSYSTLINLLIITTPAKTSTSGNFFIHKYLLFYWICGWIKEKP